MKKKERRLKIRQISSLLGMYSFDEAAAGEYAAIRAQLEREGRVISERDTLSEPLDRIYCYGKQADCCHS
jgi:predicted nucleic acid-binding protein